MKNDRRAPPPRIVVIDDGTSFNASTDWFMAGLMFAAAVAAFFFFRVPQNFDFNSRDFNPFVLLPPFLALIGVRPLYRAIRDTLVGRQFGKTVFEMESGSVELGDTLRGKICCSRAQGAVRWVLDVKAPHPGGDFRAIFALDVRPRKA